MCWEQFWPSTLHNLVPSMPSCSPKQVLWCQTDISRWWWRRALWVVRLVLGEIHTLLPCMTSCSPKHVLWCQTEISRWWRRAWWDWCWWTWTYRELSCFGQSWTLISKRGRGKQWKRWLPASLLRSLGGVCSPPWHDQLHADREPGPDEAGLMNYAW